MGLRFAIALAVGAVSTEVLRVVFRRPAANFPGKVGLYADPQLIAHLRPRVREGCIVVVGTNGKTTVSNLLADSLEAHGKVVACNRTGANLDSGVATALLHARDADWGVFESDELWLPKIAPQLQPDFVVLLNLFRDQLDRAGEINHVQESIRGALASCPPTSLVYNADDPFCQTIAESVENVGIPFGIGENLGLHQNTVADSGLCQRCEAELSYDWRQYGQLGKYRCPQCGFAREEPRFCAHDVSATGEGVSFSVRIEKGSTVRCLDKQESRNQIGKGSRTFRLEDWKDNTQGGKESWHVDSALPGTYMVYNILAVYAAASCCGVPSACTEKAIGHFSPENGRLQHYDIDGHSILLNLAKNPTGFNQNLRIVLDDPGAKAVAFFINDREADGHDVSWLWDVDFQELAGARDLVAFAGGIRRNDMQVRLKYAGVCAQLVDGATDFLAKAHAMLPDATFYLIANYTALPDAKRELDHLKARPLKRKKEQPLCVADQNHSVAGDVEPFETPSVTSDSIPNETNSMPCMQSANSFISMHHEKLVMVHLYPDLLNLYGDGGNVIVLAERARRRGIEAEVVRIEHGQTADFLEADIVFLGGGPDREQRLASIQLLEQAESLRSFVEDDGVLLAICGGYQILGREWLLGDENVAGLDVLDITTGRVEGGSHNRLVGNIALRCPLATTPVIGYENHAGRTFLGSGCKPFGYVISGQGKGNNDTDGADGVRYRNLVGTYLHGPLLSKNPEVADWLIKRALERRAAKAGRPAPPLLPIDDTCERTANEHMCARLGIA